MKKYTKKDDDLVNYWSSLPKSLRDAMTAHQIWKTNNKFVFLVVLAVLIPVGFFALIYFKDTIIHDVICDNLYFGLLAIISLIICFSWFYFYIPASFEVRETKIIWGISMHKALIDHHEIDGMIALEKNYSEIKDTIKKKHQSISVDVFYVAGMEQVEFQKVIDEILYNWLTVIDHRIDNPVDELDKYFLFIKQQTQKINV